jgi:tetratricopeptide (TPR) repeat protein
VTAGETTPTSGPGDPNRSLARTLASDADGAEPESEPSTPTAIGRFRVLDRIGRGGMGIVYAAQDDELDRRVAVKLLWDRREDGTQGSSRLKREAQAMARVSHPNVVHVYEVGTHEGRVFLAMEHIDGLDLARLVRERCPGWRETLALYRQAGAGLAAAHAAGLVHRDFKPENVLVGQDGRARVLDFGLARPDRELGTEPVAPGPERGQSSLLATDLTLEGSVMGTPAYMSPEQHLSHAVDARSDQFSFCVALYEALYGERPYAGSDRLTLTFQVTQGSVRPAPAGSRVPPWVRRTILRGLARAPEDRWPDMNALLAALDLDPARRRRRLLAAVAAVGAMAGGTFAGLRASETPCTGGRALVEAHWDDGARERVRTRLHGTGVSFAASTADRVIERLDAYASDWAQAHREACLDTAVRGQQSSEVMELRMECLDRRRKELAGLVDALSDTEADGAARAAESVYGLSPVASCADLEALRAAVPPPADPATREAVEEIRDALAVAGGLHRAGRYAQARGPIDDAVERAQATGYDPIIAQALVAQVRLDLESAAGEQLSARLAGAYWLAVGSGDDDLAAAVATLLVYMVGIRDGDLAAGEQWHEHAAAFVRRIGGRDSTQAQLLNNYGMILAARGEHEQALEHHERALALFVRDLGEDHPRVAHSVTNLAQALDKLGRREEAWAGFERAQAIRERTLGPDHPKAAIGVFNLGYIRFSQGRPAEALPLFERALAMWSASLGPDTDSAASAHNAIGACLQQLDRLDEAAAQLDRALAIQERQKGPTHRDVAKATESRAEIDLARGEWSAARDRLARSIAIWEATVGPDHLDLARPLCAAGLAAEKLHEPQVALAHFERARGLFRDRAGEPDLLARARFGVARNLVALQRDRTAALALARQAREAFAGSQGDVARELAELDAWLAAHAGPG